MIRKVYIYSKLYKDQSISLIVLISYSNKYYSFNYIRNSFVEISSEEIIKNIENNKIGIYENEIIPKISIKKEGYSK